MTTASTFDTNTPLHEKRSEKMMVNAAAVLQAMLYYMVYILPMEKSKEITITKERKWKKKKMNKYTKERKTCDNYDIQHVTKCFNICIAELRHYERTDEERTKC